MLRYCETSYAIIAATLASQQEKLNQVAQKMAQTVAEDRIIYAFGTGHSHMIPMEMFGRAGGLANVCAMLDESVLNGGGARRSSRMENLHGLAEVIWQRYQPVSGDILFLVSNSGINPVIVEMALKAKACGIFVCAITSMQQSRANESRHRDGHKLYQIADVVLDNGAPDGDALIGAGDYRIAGLSSLSGIVLANTLLCRCTEICLREGVTPGLFQSQNQDGKNANEQLFSRYQSRIPHF